MPFGIPKEGFWSVKELAYQHTHMFYGFWISYFIYCFFPIIWLPAIIGLICGMIMESYQYKEYIEEVKIPRTWVDSIRDLCFWIVGGCLNYILIFVR